MALKWAMLFMSQIADLNLPLS